MFRREVLPLLEIQRKPPRDRGSMKKGDCDTMKKFLALILTLAMALSVTACGGSDDAADDTADGEGAGTEETVDYAAMTDDELKAAITTVEDGKLTVATSPDFAPYEFYAIDENGDPQLAGFDMDLAQYIADYLGLSLEIIPMYYTELTDALRTYIKNRFGFNALEMTSSEIIDQLLELNDKEAISDLKLLFQTADLVKFAKHDPQMNENDANLINAIDFINETKQPEEENQKPQPTEITIIEKRSLRVKAMLICGIALLSAALIGTFIYIGLQLYNLFV